MITVKTAIKFLVVIILAFNFSQVSAQENSFEHVVVKGENIYRLSLRYGVSMESIFLLNPGSRTVIVVGESLRIPSKSNSRATSLNTSTNVKTYVVSKGETKYGISKKFNVSVAQLEAANPSIVRLLMAGQTIQITGSSSTLGNAPTSNLSDSSTHIVKRGETLWSISQRYGLTLDRLREINQDKSDNIILVGQELNITNNLQLPTDDTYVVIKGDTKYGLSQRFNLTISELERLNPQIIPILKSGTRIKTGTSNLAVTENDIPEKEEEEEEAKPNIVITDSSEVDSKKRYEDYTIKTKETLYSLSKKANMTIDEFLVLNPGLKESVPKGATIKMPTDRDSLKNTDASLVNQKTESVPNVEIDNSLYISVVWQESNTSSSINLKEEKSDYYSGLQKAVDSTKTLQFKNKLEFNKTTEKELLINDSANLKAPYLYIFPVDSIGHNNNSPEDIDMISLIYKHKDSTERLVIKGLPNRDAMRNRVLSFLKSKGGHAICIYDDDHTENIEQIKSVLPDTDFIATKKNGTFTDNELTSALHSDLSNFVIIESDKVGVYLGSTNILLQEMSNIDIQLVVLNPENIPSSAAVTEKRLKILRLLYPQQFIPRLNKNFNQHEALGFALNYDIFHRVLTKGLDAFKNNHITSVLGYSFNYELSNGIYQNIAVPLFVFDENSDASLISKN